MKATTRNKRLAGQKILDGALRSAATGSVRRRPYFPFDQHQLDGAIRLISLAMATPCAYNAPQAQVRQGPVENLENWEIIASMFVKLMVSSIPPGQPLSTFGPHAF